MDAIKGLARRATQSLREKVSNADQTSDDRLVEATKKVRQMEKTSVSLSDKVLRVAKLIEELGTVLKEIGEEVKQSPDLLPETNQLADDTISLGGTLVQRAQEHQAPLKEHAFDLLGNFLKELQKLRDAEEDRKKKQLEYDFFRQKVLELRKNPPKDFTRIPRNESILENWRVELWKSTEMNKAVVSTLYTQGQRAIDQSALTVGQVLNSYLNIASSGARNFYSNARLPVYSAAPLLTPAPLPPNPLPPFQYPNSGTAVPPPAQVTYSPSATDYHSPPAQHTQWAQQQGWQQQPPQQQQQPPPWNTAAPQPWAPNQPQQHPQPQQPQQQHAWQPHPSQYPPQNPHEQSSAPTQQPQSWSSQPQTTASAEPPSTSQPAANPVASAPSSEIRPRGPTE